MQSDIAASYVKAVGKGVSLSSGHDGINGTIPSPNGKVFGFQNGVGFENGNGLWSSEQGFAIGGEERLSRKNGYLSELAAAAFVCRVSLLHNSWSLFYQYMSSSIFFLSFFNPYRLHVLDVHINMKTAQYNFSLILCKS